MVVSKGKYYGRAVPRPSELAILHSDAQLAARFSINERKNLGACTISHGSIARSLGITDTKTVTETMHMIDIDLIDVQYRVKLDPLVTQKLVVAGNVVLRNALWRKELIVVSNSGFVNNRDALPKAHPNDGLLDILTVSPNMSLRQRCVAMRRAKQGSHLPHPQMIASQNSTFRWSGPALRMYADDVRINGVVWMQCDILPDALTIHF
ncbi:MAG: hypothetical protein D4R44_07725 [Actinobacteria bacterium]|nr:MAG: hypothetical protein D4R44_07725 [Actinomycetota bacterium]